MNTLILPRKLMRWLEECLSTTLSLDLNRRNKGDKALVKISASWSMAGTRTTLSCLVRTFSLAKSRSAPCSRLKNRVRSQRDSAGIVTKNKGSGMSNLKFRKKRLNPSYFCCNKSHTPVHCLGAGSCHNWLLLRPPGDEIRSKKNSSTRGWPPIIRVRSPICII